MRIGATRRWMSVFWLLGLLALGTPSGAQSAATPNPDGASVNAILQQFFDLYQKKDLSGLEGLWDSHSVEYAGRFSQMARLFRHEEYSFPSWNGTSQISTAGKGGPEWAQVRVTVDCTVSDLLFHEQRSRDPKSGQEIITQEVSGRKPRPTVRLNRYFLLAKTDRWRILSYVPLSDHVVAQLIAAPALARDRVIADEGEHVTSDVAFSLLNLADGLYRRASSDSDYAPAQILYDADASFFTRLKLMGWFNTALLDQGQTFYARRRYAEAATYYRQALRIALHPVPGWAAAGHRLAVINDYCSLAAALDSSGDQSGARTAYAEARRHAIEPADRNWVAWTDRRLGELAEQEQPVNAARHFASAEHRYDALHDEADQNAVRAELASVLTRLSRYRDADRLYQAAADHDIDVYDSQSVAVCRLGIGLIWSAQGDYQAADTNLRAACSAFQSSNDKGNLAAALDGLADLHASQGKAGPSLYAASLALRLAYKTGDQDSETFSAGCLLNTWVMAAARGAQLTVPNLPALTASRGGTSTAVRPPGIPLLRTELDALHLTHADAACVLPLYRRLLSGKLHRPDQSSALLVSMAAVKLASGDAHGALDVCRSAETLAQAAGSLEIGWRAYAADGVACERLGDKVSAYHRFESAIGMVEALRSELAGQAEQQGQFLRDKTWLYRHMVAVLAHTGGGYSSAASALQYSEAVKGRVLLDALLRGRLALPASVYGPLAQRSQLDAMITPTRALELLPDSRTALLEFCNTPDRTFLFILTRPHGAHPLAATLHVCDVPRAPLDHQIQLVRAAVSDPHSPEGILDAVFARRAATLYSMLLPPVAQAQIADKPNLIIVPDGKIWQIPFPSLVSRNGAQVRFMADDHAISLDYSLTWLLQQRRQRNQHPRQPITLLTLDYFPHATGVGKADVSKDAVTASALGGEASSPDPLPNIQREYRGLPCAQYSGGASEKSCYLQKARLARIIYIRSHGCFDDRDPMNSWLALGAAGRDRYLRARDMAVIPLNADLAILSACETGRGQANEGEGLIGITWALALAGCRASVVSQWQVRPAAMDALMLEYHRLISRQCRRRQGGFGKAAALRVAELHVEHLERRDPLTQQVTRPYMNPYFWSAFTLVGDGGDLEQAKGVRSLQHPETVTPSPANSTDSHRILTHLVVGIGDKNDWHTHVEPRPGDSLTFRILLANTGLTVGRKPRVTVTLDGRLTYIPNSSSELTKQGNHNVFIRIPDAFIKIRGRNMTWGFGNMPPRPQFSLYLEFKARLVPPQRFPINRFHPWRDDCKIVVTDGPHPRLMQEAIVRANTFRVAAWCSFEGSLVRTNFATVQEDGNTENVTRLALRYQVTNLTLRATLLKNEEWKFYHDYPAVASPGDTLGYSLNIMNRGTNTVRGIKVKVTLSPRLAYSGTTRLFDDPENPKGRLIRGANVCKDGVVLGYVNRGNDNAQNLHFRAQVSTLINRPLILPASAVLGLPSPDLLPDLLKDAPGITRDADPGHPGKYIMAANDKADVFVAPERGLQVLQELWDNSDKQFSPNEVRDVAEGETFVCRVLLANNTRQEIRNVTVWLGLPCEFDYVAGTLNIDGEKATSGLESAFQRPKYGIIVTDMPPGFCQAITFQARANGLPTLGLPVTSSLVKVTTSAKCPILYYGRLPLSVRY
jgi:uncharacterized repeat protein (TIGR01451 family)